MYMFWIHLVGVFDFSSQSLADVHWCTADNFEADSESENAYITRYSITARTFFGKYVTFAFRISVGGRQRTSVLNAQSIRLHIKTDFCYIRWSFAVRATTKHDDMMVTGVGGNETQNTPITVSTAAVCNRITTRARKTAFNIPFFFSYLKV